MDTNSGLIDGYKERLWLRLHLIFLQSSLKELSIRERRRKPWTSGVGWVILKDLSLSLSWWNLYSWEISENIHLQPDVQDQHIWMLLALATTLANLPIMNSFLGPLGSLHGRGFGSLGPLRCKIFIWFEVLNCCWTADRLPKLGLPRPAACPLCDKPQNILTICWIHVWWQLAREVWFTVFQKFGLHTLSPQLDVNSFSGWWN